jgi:uncharacterized protein YwgA
MDRQKLVLAALAAGGENATFAPVQVQKLFFLIDREACNLVGGRHFAFAPYDYGPYDQAVYDELERLKAIGLLDIRPTGRYRVYTLTPEGFRKGSLLLGDLGEPAEMFIRKAASWVRSMNFQQLVSAIYKYYPDMKINSVFRQ